MWKHPGAPCKACNDSFHCVSGGINCPSSLVSWLLRGCFHYHHCSLDRAQPIQCEAGLIEQWRLGGWEDGRGRKPGSCLCFARTESWKGKAKPVLLPCGKTGSFAVVRKFYSTYLRSIPIKSPCSTLPVVLRSRQSWGVGAHPRQEIFVWGWGGTPIRAWPSSSFPKDLALSCSPYRAGRGPVSLDPVLSGSPGF